MYATGMTYIRAQKAQIDAWEALGNPGWNWDALLPYYKKAEGFILPTSAQADDGASFDPTQHGDAGLVSVGFPSHSPTEVSFMRPATPGQLSVCRTTSTPMMATSTASVCGH
jgi:choline dehydrogenase-like flavoprotein